MARNKYYLQCNGGIDLIIYHYASTFDHTQTVKAVQFMNIIRIHLWNVNYLTKNHYLSWNNQLNKLCKTLADLPFSIRLTIIRNQLEGYKY